MQCAQFAGLGQQRAGGAIARVGAGIGDVLGPGRRTHRVGVDPVHQGVGQRLRLGRVETQRRQQRPVRGHPGVVALPLFDRAGNHAVEVETAAAIIHPHLHAALLHREGDLAAVPLRTVADRGLQPGLQAGAGEILAAERVPLGLGDRSGVSGAALAEAHVVEHRHDQHGHHRHQQQHREQGHSLLARPAHAPPPGSTNT